MQQDQKQTTVDALEGLRVARRVAGEIAESADAYISAMESSDRPKIEPGNYYRTFDGSLAFVLRRHTKCRCPICTGRGSPFLSIFGIAQPEPDEDPQHQEADEPLLFVAVIIRGGHRMAGVTGENPGAKYVVDSRGLVVLNNVDTPRGDVSRALLALAGLSFARKLTAKFE